MASHSSRVAEGARWTSTGRPSRATARTSWKSCIQAAPTTTPAAFAAISGRSATENGSTRTGPDQPARTAATDSAAGTRPWWSRRLIQRASAPAPPITTTGPAPTVSVPSPTAPRSRRAVNDISAPMVSRHTSREPAGSSENRKGRDDVSLPRAGSGWSLNHAVTTGPPEPAR